MLIVGAIVREFYTCDWKRDDVNTQAEATAFEVDFKLMNEFDLDELRWDQYLIVDTWNGLTYMVGVTDATESVIIDSQPMIRHLAVIENKSLRRTFYYDQWAERLVRAGATWQVGDSVEDVVTIAHCHLSAATVRRFFAV